MKANCLDTNNNGLNKRIQYIDTAKAMGICFVILSHSVVPPVIHAWIRSFVMPLFFFLSGLTFKMSNAKDFFKKRCFSLLFLYIIFCLVYIAKDFASFLLKNDGSLELIAKRLLGIFLCIEKTDYMVSGMWFLPCLFVCESIMFALVKVLKNNGKMILAVSLVMCALEYAVDELFNISLPWCSEVALFVTVFMAMGYTQKDRLNKLLGTAFNKKPATALALVVLLLISVATAYCNYKLTDSYVELSSNLYGNILLTIPSALCGIAVIILASNRLNSRLASYIGQNSLFIYLFHFLLFIGDYHIKLFNLVKPIIKNSYATGILVSLLYMILILAVTCLLAKPYNMIMKKIKNKVF